MTYTVSSGTLNPTQLNSTRKKLGLRDLMANIFEEKHDIDIGERRWKLRRVHYAVSTNFINFGPQTPKNGTVICTHLP